MRFASVTHDGQPLAVAIDGDHATPLRGISELGAATPSAVLAAPPLDDSVSIPVSALRFRPVVPNPSKVICVGLNYLAHIQETGNAEGEYPVLFPKWASSLTGAYDPIPKPPESDQVDYEVELAIVIGTAGRRISKQAAFDHIGGYTVANDTSMRDYQYKTAQYLQGKAWEAATPVGPELVTPDEIADVANLTLKTTVNGNVLQESTTALMIYDIPTLIATISEVVSLSPGDLILTGTPSGVGARQEPPLFLFDGDLVECEVVGVGALKNTVVNETV